MVVLKDITGQQLAPEYIHFRPPISHQEKILLLPQVIITGWYYILMVLMVTTIQMQDVLPKYTHREVVLVLAKEHWTE
jgi:hypothetical protein